MVAMYQSHPSKHKALKNFRQLCGRIDWIRLIFTGGLPLLAIIIGILWVPFQLNTAIFAHTYGFCSGISITAGYHRLWAHRAYSAHPLLKIALAILGASAGQGSIRTWCRDHRAHHRYVDTDQDPYSVHKGLLYAHYGWVIIRRKPEQTGPVDIQDLTNDHIVMWQRQCYTLLLVLTGFVFPTLLCGLLLNDFLGGFIYASCLRLFLIQQCTFCVNSLAHWIGEQPFTGRHSPRDSWLVALITFGEGYHNFHHEFPMDYRNGYRRSDYDPTKWFIWLCAHVNLASDLKRFPSNEIQKGHLQQAESQLQIQRQEISWGTPIDELPALSLSQYTEYVRDGYSLIVIDGVAHDVSQFINHHPGGVEYLRKYVGKDATKLFHGGIYTHSNAAENLLSTMRFARIINSAHQGC
ncbi:hypothetical protein BBP40_002515 [Aspergillus hancockii]|nr:hypothetical protein BBP40_002515 [Aspergillus hancockii]